jgi:hypothetical protein
MHCRRDYESRPRRFIPLKPEGQKERELSELMSWLVLFTTVIFPLLLVVLLVMDLVDPGPKQLVSPLPQGRDKPHDS